MSAQVDAEGTGAATGRRMIHALRVYWPPLLGLACTGPVVIYALSQSLAWPGAVFPGFFLAPGRIVPNVSTLTWPEDRAALFHSELIEIDRQEVTSKNVVYDTVASQPAGTVFSYRFRKLEREFERSVSSRHFNWSDYWQTFGILITFGCLSAAMALIVGFLQPRTPSARVYLLSGCVAGLYPILGSLLYGPDSYWLNRMYSVVEALFPSTWIHLALVFPVERALPGGRLPWLVVPYAISAALAAWMLYGIHGQPPDLSGVYMTYQFAALAIIFFYGVTAYAYFERPDPAARLRLRPVFVALIAATVLPLITFAVNAAANIKIPVQFGLILAPVFYLALMYSIARHELFDVERVKREAALYVLLSAVLAATYALILGAVSRLAPDYAGRGHGIAAVLFALIAAVGIEPAKAALQRLLDRAFRRGEIDFRATISELSESLTTFLDEEAVVHATTQTIVDAMGLERVALCTFDAERDSGAMWTLQEGEWNGPEAEPRVRHVVALFANEPGEATRAEVLARCRLPEAASKVEELLTRSNAALVVPLRWRDRAVGLLILGEKQSGQPFTSGDRAVLRTLANQVAVALVNARSYGELRELNRDLDERVRRQASQLVQSEKMASLGQLVAGVAHELNNPASFIFGAIDSLKDFTARFTTVLRAYQRALAPESPAADEVRRVERQVRVEALLREAPEVLHFCAEGAERIKQIVDDLRLFVRADLGERTPTNVRAGIENTVALLWNRISKDKVRILQDYQDIGLIQANPGQLNQVWMNLLTNALDAVAGCSQPEVRVSVQAAPPAASNHGQWIEVRVADNGRGMSAEVREHIFEPFYTTKPVGQGTGLGMSIVYSVVRSHGGAIDIESEEGAGSTCVVRLPAEPAEMPARALVADDSVRAV